MMPNIRWSDLLSEGSGASAVHLVGKVGRRSFGLGALVIELVRQQRALGLGSVIWCLDEPAELEWLMITSGISASQLKRYRPSWPARFGYSSEMERQVREFSGTPPCVVHRHSLWTGLSRVSNLWRRHGVPTIVAAQGALEPWALRKSTWKKKLALLGYERENLERAACLHACGEMEVANYRAFGLKNPVALIPNGISDDWMKASGDGMSFRRKYGLGDQDRILLYISRITPKKGLPMLIEGMHGLRRELQGWILVIAGVDEFRHQREIEALVKKYGIESKVRFIGPIYAADKRNAYAAADLFILPTHSEGNPLVVLEALGASVPVITTKGAPWGDLVRYRCGWWTDISTTAIGDALSAALRTSREDLRKSGERGRDLVRTNYNWFTIAKKTISLYDWIGGKGAQPEFVQVF